MAAYQLVFWIPTVVSLWGLARLRREGFLYGRSAAAFAAWFLLALAAQALAPSPAVWILGFVAQTALAIVLEIRRKTGL